MKVATNAYIIYSVHLSSSISGDSSGHSRSRLSFSLLNFRTSVFLFEPPSAILSVLCPWVLMTVIQYRQLCAHILSPQDLKCLHKKDGVITRYDLFPNNDMPKVLLVQCSIEVVEPRRGGAE